MFYNTIFKINKYLNIINKIIVYSLVTTIYFEYF